MRTVPSHPRTATPYLPAIDELAPLSKVRDARGCFAGVDAAILRSLKLRQASD